MAYSEDVVISCMGHVVRVTLNRPERRNALTVPMMDAVREAVEAAQTDPDCRAIVLTGAGDRAFCAGADLSSDDTPFKPDFAQLSLPFANLLRAMQASSLPILCAVNGTCVAGGMGFMGVCDIVIASATAKFGMPEAKVGIFPMQIVAVLQGLIPERDMRELCLTGRIMDAEEANRIRLVNCVVPPDQLEAEIRSWTGMVLAASPMAIRRGKYAMRAMRDMSFEQMIAFAETMVGPMIMTQDAREGLEAFAQKRSPNWPNA